MATFSAAKDTRILFDAYDLSTYFSEASVPYTGEAVETTTFQASAKARIKALKDGSFSANGFLDESTAGGAGTIIGAALSSTSNAHEISVYPDTDTIGKFGHGLSATTTKHEISAPVAGVVEASAEAESSKAAERIVSLHALGAETAGTITPASVDNAASTTAGAVGYLHVTAITGGTITSITVQDSTDDSVWADLVTFTTPISSTTSERVQVTGTVDRYTRVRAVLNGGTATFQAGVGRYPHT